MTVPESSVLLHSCCSTCSPTHPPPFYLPPSDFGFLRFFFFPLYLNQSVCVRTCECVSSNPPPILATCGRVLPSFLPALHAPPSSLPSPVCTHCKCGILKSTDPHPRPLTLPYTAGSSSFLVTNVFTTVRTWEHRKWLTRCPRIASWCPLGFFLLRQREQKQKLLLGPKDDTSRHPFVRLYSSPPPFLSNLTDFLSVP